MPKTPHLPDLPKNHSTLSSAEEKEERVLNQIEIDNSEDIQGSVDVARNISLLQSGVGEQIAAVLTRGFVGVGGSSAVASKTVEERVQNELYKAVIGNQINETEFGKDARNYLDSTNAEYLKLNATRRAFQQFKRIIKGGHSMIGGTNYGEGILVDRFGKNTNLEQRRKFVAQRMRKFLDEMFTSRKPVFEEIADMLGKSRSSTVDVIEEAFAETDLSTTERIEDWCMKNSERLSEQSTFKDLKLLLKVQQEKEVLVGVEGVHDFQGLREFYETLKSKGGKCQELIETLDKTLDDNSLFPLETNPKARLFLAKMRSKFNMAFYHARRSGSVNNAAAAETAAASLLAEVNDIRKNLEDSAQTVEKLSPLVLLQRFEARDYLVKRGLNTNGSSEEANKYAVSKVINKLEQLKSADTIRSGNHKAAEFAQKGMLERTVDKLRGKVAGVQSFIGLEPFDIKTMAEGAMIEKIANSHPDLHVFRGVNKFTTTRDLRKILKTSGKVVPKIVVERFMKTLEEAISEYKSVVPELNSQIDAGDWNIEDLIDVLRKLKNEMWTNEMIVKAAKEPGANREQIMMRIFREGEIEAEKVSAALLTEIQHPDAIWRKILFKNELKKILDKEILDANNDIKKVGIADREDKIKSMESEASALPNGDAKRLKLQEEISAEKMAVSNINKQIKESTDLYSRVEDAKKYIAEKKLSRSQRKEYLAQIGMTQIFDTMGTNFRFQRYWAATKRGVFATGRGLKRFGAMNRRVWLNSSTAKKAFSLGRIGVIPVTGTLGYALKAGSFPFRLVGRGVRGVARVPGRLFRMMSKNAMRKYIRNKRLDLSLQNQKLTEKQSKLAARLSKVPYSWDRTRIMERINDLEEKKAVLQDELNELSKLAEKNKISVSTVNIAGVPASDNKSAAPAAKPKAA